MPVSTKIQNQDMLKYCKANKIYSQALSDTVIKTAALAVLAILDNSDVVEARYTFDQFHDEVCEHFITALGYQSRNRYTFQQKAEHISLYMQANFDQTTIDEVCREIDRAPKEKDPEAITMSLFNMMSAILLKQLKH